MIKRRIKMFEKERYILAKNIDSKLVDVFKEHKCILAGGAITSIFSGNSIKDYDIYFQDEEKLELFKAILWSQNRVKTAFGDTASILCRTDNAVTVSINNKTFQFIILEELVSSYPIDIIEHFDFTVCMGTFDFLTKDFYFGKNFFRHLAQRSLVYNINSNYPFASLYRVIKYLKKGFKISGIEMLKLGLKCNAIKINNFKELRKQLMGIDTLFLKDLTDKLNGEEMASKAYDFDLFLQMMDEHLSKLGEFNVEEQKQ